MRRYFTFFVLCGALSSTAMLQAESKAPKKAAEPIPGGASAAYRLRSGKVIQGDLISITKREVVFVVGKTKVSYEPHEVPIIALRETGAYYYMPNLRQHSFITYEAMSNLQKQAEANAAARNSNKGNADAKQLLKAAGGAAYELLKAAADSGLLDRMVKNAYNTSVDDSPSTSGSPSTRPAVGAAKGKGETKKSEPVAKKSDPTPSASGTKSFLRGTVVYKNGQTASGIRVRGLTSALFDSGDFTQEVITDSKGRFELSWNGADNLKTLYVDGDVALRDVRRNTDVTATLKR